MLREPEAVFQKMFDITDKPHVLLVGCSKDQIGGMDDNLKDVIRKRCQKIGAVMTEV